MRGSRYELEPFCSVNTEETLGSGTSLISHFERENAESPEAAAETHGFDATGLDIKVSFVVTPMVSMNGTENVQMVMLRIYKIFLVHL